MWTLSLFIYSFKHHCFLLHAIHSLGYWRGLITTVYGVPAMCLVLYMHQLSLSEQSCEVEIITPILEERTLRHESWITQPRSYQDQDLNPYLNPKSRLSETYLPPWKHKWPGRGDKQVNWKSKQILIAASGQVTFYRTKRKRDISYGERLGRLCGDRHPWALRYE